MTDFNSIDWFEAASELCKPIKEPGIGSVERWRRKTNYYKGDYNRGYMSGYCAGRHGRPLKNLDGFTQKYQDAYRQGWKAGMLKRDSGK